MDIAQHARYDIHYNLHFSHEDEDFANMRQDPHISRAGTKTQKFSIDRK